MRNSRVIVWLAIADEPELRTEVDSFLRSTVPEYATMSDATQGK